MAHIVKAKVLVAEDHAVVGEALVRLINRQTDMICCGRIESAGAIVSAIEKKHPDLVLLDLLLKDEDARRLIPNLVFTFPDLRLLVFSQMEEIVHAENILKAGAHGFITKTEPTREVLAAIRTVLDGRVYLSRKMTTRLMHRFVEKPSSETLPKRPTHQALSPREEQVLQLIGSGRKTREIAGQLKLSVKTIETHRENIKRKLGLQTAPELAHHAIQWVEGRTP